MLADGLRWREQALAKTLAAPFIKSDKDKDAKSLEEIQGLAKGVKRELENLRKTVRSLGLQVGRKW